MLGWRLGVRRNRALVLESCAVLERVFRPVDTLYTNIGGLVGYNFTYELSSGPLSRLEGTITTMPRQAVLYYPISRLLGREDCLVITAFLESLPSGEAHVVDLKQYQHGWITVADGHDMEQLSIDHGGRELAIFFYNRVLQERMAGLLEKLERVACLRYLGYYGSDGRIVLRLDPSCSSLEESLQHFLSMLEQL